ncbi:unnamed protein product [Rotaria magnacalcarata]
MRKTIEHILLIIAYCILNTESRILLQQLLKVDMKFMLHLLLLLHRVSLWNRKKKYLVYPQGLEVLYSTNVILCFLWHKKYCGYF